MAVSENRDLSPCCVGRRWLPCRILRPRGTPLFERFNVRVGEQQRRMRNISGSRLVEHEAKDVLDLRAATAFDVTQHRGCVLRVALGERLLPRSHKDLAGGVTNVSRHGSATLKLVEKQLASSGGTDNLANVRSHQAAHRSCG